jgi:hypothetical protein
MPYPPFAARCTSLAPAPSPRRGNPASALPLATLFRCVARHSADRLAPPVGAALA